MKQIFASLILLLSAGTAAATLTSDMSNQWVKTLDAVAPDIGNAIKLIDGSLYTFSVTGSTIGDGGTGWPKEYTDTARAIYYDGVKIAVGAPYEGSSYNNNFNLLKTDLQGNFLWTVYSTSGEFAANNGDIVAAPDGGVYVAAKIRHTDNMRTTNLSLTDATGAVTEIPWTLADEDVSRNYKGLIMKISAEGAIQWYRLIDVSTDPQPNAGSNYQNGTFDALYLNGMLSDDQGNIYLSGRYANPVTFYTASGSKTLTPHNTEGWNGDSQTSVGDMFIAKFDGEGYLTDVLTTTGKAYLETLPVLAWAEGDIILNCIVKGTGAETDAISLGGKEIALPTAYQCMLTARMDTDFNVKWTQLFTGSQNSNRVPVMHYNHVNAVDGHLWLTGMGNFTLTSSDGAHTLATTDGKTREGYIIRCDLATGEWLAATTSRIAYPGIGGIAGFLGGFEGAEDNCFYAYGYSFGSLSVSLSKFDGETLERLDSCYLFTGGSMTTATEFVADGNTFYAMMRARDMGMTGYEPTVLGGTQITTFANTWAVVLAAYNMPVTVKQDAKEIAVGDVNADDEVNIADVNALISIILGNSTAEDYAGVADVNGDAEINIADVNAVIAIILGD